MNQTQTWTTRRILSWAGFVIIIGLIIWGMIAASNKAERESQGIAPVDKVSNTDWAMGSATSSVTLIEYSDFQCPACGLYFPVIEQIMADMGDRVQFVYRHFPLSQHANAMPAAQATQAAGNQGKFWEMYRMIFETQKEWELVTNIKPVFAGYAVKLGLDMAKYAIDVESKENLSKINNDVKSGLKAGVNSTPTFYLNGKKISPQSYEDFKKLIDATSATSTNP